MFPKTLRLGYYSKEAAIFYYIYLKKSLIEKCFKCPEEKEEKMNDYVKFLVKQIVENSDGYFGEFNEKLVDEVLDKENRKM